MKQDLQIDKIYSLSDLPKKENKGEVGMFIHKLVMLGDREKIRLGLEDRWKYNHRMFRGNHWGESSRAHSSKNLTLNLLFANIQRTAANLTAKEPVVEAIESGNDAGVDDDAGRILTAWLRKWWDDTKQPDSMVDSAQQMEVYGPTIEKAFFNDLAE